MEFLSIRSNIRTIHQGDAMFTITGNHGKVPRAGFEVVDKCPSDYTTIIYEAIARGWLKPVAYMRDDELMWEKIRG